MKIAELYENQQVLYHVSETKNESGILQHGILRRDKDWPPHFSELDKEIALDIEPDSIYKQRIYLFGTLERSAVSEFMSIVFSERYNLTITPGEPNLLLPFTVFAIDTMKLPGFRFYPDTASDNEYKSVWTDSGDIPPAAISVHWRSPVDYSGSKYLENLW